MPTMMVGTRVLKKGEEYSGLIPNGNAFRVMQEGHRVSINRGEFATISFNEDIYATPDITYTFEEDTEVILTRIVAPDLSTIYTNSNESNIALITDTESAAIVEVTVLEATTTGTVSYICNITNDNNQDINITIRVYDATVALFTDIYVIPSNTSTEVSFKHELVSPIEEAGVIHFTVEADDDAMIMGTEYISILQINKRT